MKSVLCVLYPMILIYNFAPLARIKLVKIDVLVCLKQHSPVSQFATVVFSVTLCQILVVSGNDKLGKSIHTSLVCLSLVNTEIYESRSKYYSHSNY